MKKVIILLSLVAFFGCKKETTKPEPIYDDRVQSGWYVGVDRPDNKMYVNKPDTNLVRIDIYRNNTQFSYNCRRYNNSVGYEFPNSNKVVRFRTANFDGKLGYVIVGDTLVGVNFVKIF